MSGLTRRSRTTGRTRSRPSVEPHCGCLFTPPEPEYQPFAASEPDLLISLAVLGSGSGGNCTLVRLHGGRPRSILIDLGLSPRATRRRLHDIGASYQEVSDILITHADLDHFAPTWATPIQQPGAPRLRAHGRHVGGLAARGVPPTSLMMLESPAVPLDEFTGIRSLVLPHDGPGATGFIIEHMGARLGFATDLGRVTPELLESFAGVDILCIESNYDPDMQLASPRPEMLKSRIMGGSGHLSNEQALEAALTLDAHAPLSRVVLLHLSRQCNDPALVRSLWQRRAPRLAERLVITSQHHPTAFIGLRLPLQQAAMDDASEASHGVENRSGMFRPFNFSPGFPPSAAR